MKTATGIRDGFPLRHGLALAVAVLVTYALSLSGDVVGDDLILIEKARSTAWSFSGLAQAFAWDQATITAGWVPETFRAFHLQYFRPLLMAGLKLEYSLWQTWAAGYHITNLFLYFFITLFVYAWAADFGLGRRQQFIAGLLFATFSLNNLAVNQINGRTELLATLFIVPSIIWLGRFYRSKNPIGYILAFVAAVLALGTKENAVMLPFFHLCAAFLLYPPNENSRVADTRLRLLAILPFFLLIPSYLLIRSATLDGFPIPPGGFYFHHPSSPGFAGFVISKLAHYPLALIFQLPAYVPPSLVARSFILLTLAVLIAAGTVFVVVHWMTGPFRYFFLIWMTLGLAPTLLMGQHPIYFFLCSPVVIMLYVKLYDAFANSERRWHRRAARSLLILSIGGGVIIGNIGAVSVKGSGLPSKAIALSTIEVLAQYPEAVEVYFLDVPASSVFMLAPQIRYRDASSAARSFSHLGVTADVRGRVLSEVEQVDAYTFDVRPQSGAYLRTGMEEFWLAKPLPRFEVGMVETHPKYEMEIVEVEAGPIRDGGPITRGIRAHLEMPQEDRNGILRLRYRFKTALASAQRLFLQIDGTEVRVVEFSGGAGP